MTSPRVPAAKPLATSTAFEDFSEKSTGVRMRLNISPPARYIAFVTRSGRPRPQYSLHDSRAGVVPANRTVKPSCSSFGTTNALQSGDDTKRGARDEA